MAQRITAREAIERFLSDELAELGVKRGARHLITTPKDIAKHTGLDLQVVKKSLSMTTGRKESANVVVVRVGGTDVVIRLASRGLEFPSISANSRTISSRHFAQSYKR